MFNFTDYISGRNVLALYAHDFFYRIGMTAMYLLTGTYFMDLGISLPLIILFFGLEFGLRGFLCPLGIYVFNRIGIIPSLILSNGFKIIFFLILSLVEHNPMYMFFGLIFASMGSAIYSPFKDIMENIYLDGLENRSKRLSMSIILSSFSAVISVLLGAYLLTNYGFISVAFMVAAGYMASVIVLFFTKTVKDINISNYHLKDGYGFILSEEVRDFILPTFAEQLRIIMNIVFIPLFIFSIVGDMKVFSYLAASALLVEMLVTLFMGHKADKKGVSSALKTSLFMNIGTSTFLMFCVVSPLTAFVGEALNKITMNTHSVPFRAGIQAVIHEREDGNLMLFGCTYQMLLCFGELLALPTLAVFAYFFGHLVFPVSFVLGALGCFISWRYFAIRENQSVIKEVSVQNGAS